MPRILRPVDELPRRNATQVKNQWRDLVREVRTSGSVAVTNHGTVDMVVLDAAKYQELVALAADAGARQQAALAELTAEFDRRLEELQARETRKRVEAALASRGRIRRRPKAGSSF